VLDPKIHSNNLLNSILAKVEANVAGADDALLLDSRGFLAETNATHLFFLADGVLCTPTTAACPEGITRATVLRLAADGGIRCLEGDFSLPQLYAAEEAFVTGTMGELTPVLTVDGRRIGAGDPGALTRRLSAAYAALTATSGTVVA
jgi:branched-chain amino acid aminotransferase